MFSYCGTLHWAPLSRTTWWGPEMISDSFTILISGIWAGVSSSLAPLPVFGFKNFILSCSTIPSLSNWNQCKTFPVNKLFVLFPNQITAYHFPFASVCKWGGHNNLQLLSITSQESVSVSVVYTILLIASFTFWQWILFSKRIILFFFSWVLFFSASSIFSTLLLSTLAF